MDVDGAIRKTWRYWYIDGLAEMAMGCLFAVVGLLFLVETWLPEGPLKASFSALGLPVVVLGGALVARQVVAALKSRLTYPRTGYVTYRRAGGRRALKGLIVGAITGLVVATLAAKAPASEAWIPALQGLAIAAGCLYLGYRLDLSRFYALGAFSALAGMAASLAGLGEILGAAAYYGALGAGLIVSGGLTLWGYLKQTQPLAEAQDHGQ